MKPLFAISSAMNDSARIQSSQTGEPAKTYVFVFVPVYITGRQSHRLHCPAAICF